MTTSPFNDSLIRNRAETREQATTHIEAEEDVLRKNGSLRSKQPRYNENNRDHSARSNEVFIEKRTDQRYVPYVAKKEEHKTKAKEEMEIRPRFWVSYKEFIGMPRVADRLKFPKMTDRFLGSRRDIWCDASP